MSLIIFVIFVQHVSRTLVTELALKPPWHSLLLLFLSFLSVLPHTSSYFSQLRWNLQTKTQSLPSSCSKYWKVEHTHFKENTLTTFFCVKEKCHGCNYEGMKNEKEEEEEKNFIFVTTFSFIWLKWDFWSQSLEPFLNWWWKEKKIFLFLILAISILASFFLTTMIVAIRKRREKNAK